jgi:hypothetical protein
MTSREKVLALRGRLLELQPEDEGQAQQLQILAALTPMLVRAIPDDPAELDGYLRTIAWGAVECRSDESPPVAVFEWNGASWERVEIGEIGP